MRSESLAFCSASLRRATCSRSASRSVSDPGDALVGRRCRGDRRRSSRLCLRGSRLRLRDCGRVRLNVRNGGKRPDRVGPLCLGGKSVTLERELLPFGFEALTLGAEMLALDVEPLPLSNPVRLESLSFRLAFHIQPATLGVERLSRALTLGLDFRQPALPFSVEDGDTSLTLGLDFLFRFLADARRRHRRSLLDLGTQAGRHLGRVALCLGAEGRERSRPTPVPPQFGRE